MYTKRSIYSKNRDIHYVILEEIDGKTYWVHVFDYQNLMLYLLDATQDISHKEFYYAEKLSKSFKTMFLYREGSHKLNKSKLLKQAYEWESKNPVRYEYCSYLDAYMIEEESRKWHDKFSMLPIDEKEWEYDPHIGYYLRKMSKHTRGHTSHTVSGFSTPKTLWRKIKNGYRMADIRDDDYEEDYYTYLTHKKRYNKSEELGWWDDHPRARRSCGWKESTKRRFQYKASKTERKSDYVSRTKIGRLHLLETEELQDEENLFEQSDASAEDTLLADV